MQKEDIKKEQAGFFGKRKWIYIAIVTLLLLLGFVIRIYDISDLPLDFHPTRQLFTAIAARSRFLQLQPEGVVPEWQLEKSQRMLESEVRDAPIYDGLIVILYQLFGSENLVTPRVVSIIFWLLGGVGIYLFAKDMTSADGGILALAVYLFMQFSVIVSRTIQPDPLMTCIIIFTWMFMYRWLEKQTWKWAVFAGILGGLAVLTKALAAFSILGSFLAIILILGFKKAIKNPQFWVMGVIVVVPTLIYMVIGFFVKGDLGSQFSLRFFPENWIDPVFYLQWERMIEKVAGLLPFVLAIVGIFFFDRSEDRKYMLSLWVGYIIFGIIFSYFFATHDYYHITIVPLIALSVAIFGKLLANRFQNMNYRWLMKALLVSVILIAIGANLWDVRDILHKTDYRGQDQIYAQIGEKIGNEHSVAALTQDYGYRLQYWGWLTPSYIWQYTGDMAIRGNENMDQIEFDELFFEVVETRDYFIVTDLVELEKQPMLKEALQNYPIFDIGEGYIIYDLHKPAGGSG